jgi:hypothetical protein
MDKPNKLVTPCSAQNTFSFVQHLNRTNAIEVNQLIANVLCHAARSEMPINADETAMTKMTMPAS